MQDEPYMMMKENAAFLTGNDRFEGYLADILRLIAARLRFDYEICLSTDGSYGEQNAHGHWNGVIGELARGVSEHRARHLYASHSVRKSGHKNARNLRRLWGHFPIRWFSIVLQKCTAVKCQKLTNCTSDRIWNNFVTFAHLPCRTSYQYISRYYYFSRFRYKSAYIGTYFKCQEFREEWGYAYFIRHMIEHRSRGVSQNVV